MKKKAIYKIINGKLGEEIYIKDEKTDEYTGYFKEFPSLLSKGNTIKETRKRLWQTASDTLKHLIGNFKNKK